MRTFKTYRLLLLISFITTIFLFFYNRSKVRKDTHKQLALHFPVKIHDVKLYPLEVNSSKCSDILNGFRLSELPIELQLPIAYSILAYREADQIYRLLRAIYRRHNYYCIHVDRKSDRKLFDTVQSWTRCLPNLIVPDGRNRINVNWGRISTLKAELTCIRLLSNASSTWKYFINLTGQEFPLKTNVELVAILGAFDGSNDVAHGPFPQGYRTVGYTEDGKSHHKFDPSPEGINLFAGSAHVILSRAFTNYIVTNGFHVRRLFHWMRDINCADEAFFQTLNNNPQLHIPSTYTRANVSGGEIARLKNRGGQPCHGKWLRGVCMWGPDDLDYITAPGRKQLFVNKFVTDINGDTYTMLEKWFQNQAVKTYSEWTSSPFDVSFYKKSKLSHSRF